MACKHCKTSGTTPQTCTYEYCAPKARGHSIQHSMAYGQPGCAVSSLAHLVWLETCKAISEDAEARNHAQWYLDEHRRRCEARETLQANSFPIAVLVALWQDRAPCPFCRDAGILIESDEVWDCQGCRALTAWRTLNPHHRQRPLISG